jgi:hypothetical protein
MSCVKEALAMQAFIAGKLSTPAKASRSWIENVSIRPEQDIQRGLILVNYLLFG